MSGHRVRAGAVLVAVLTVLVCSSGTAFAHVTVQPSAAAPGSETTFTFQVPTEKDDASTVKIVLALPAARPIPVVSVEPVPGWKAQVVSRKLPKPVQTDDGPVTTAVSRITWSAADRASAIAPGQFRRFTIQAGPLPDSKRLVFKALQYYSDGTVVRWIDPPVPGGEPAHPAPAVTLRPDTTATGTDGAAAASGAGFGGDGWIAVAAFVAGLLGLAAGTAALVVARRAGAANEAPR